MYPGNNARHHSVDETVVVNEREIARLAKWDSYSWWTRGRRSVIQAVLKRMVLDRLGMAADIGCGAGGMFELLKNCGADKIIGVDVSPLAAALCLHKSYLSVVIGSAEELPFQTASLRSAIMADVLEHVQDDERALRECARMMKPGAVLIVTVPAYPWMYSQHDRALGHFRRYSGRGLRRLLNQCGFQVVTITHYNMLLFPFALLARMASMVRRSGRHPVAGSIAPAEPWNWLAYNVFVTERFFLRWSDLPFGLSLLGICRKPSTSAERSISQTHDR